MDEVFLKDIDNKIPQPIDPYKEAAAAAEKDTSGPEMS